MFKQIAKQFCEKFEIAGLNLLKVLLYIIGIPVMVVFLMYGLWFVVCLFLWVVLVDAAFVTAILVFCANFIMFFVALFNVSLWEIMGNMWSWLWGWFADGNVWLWPHFVKSFLPYIGAGLLLSLLFWGI